MPFTSNSDKITRDYFDSLLVETRYLDAVIPSTKMTLFGETFRTIAYPVKGQEELVPLDWGQNVMVERYG